jgi:hypothetical protein
MMLSRATDAARKALTQRRYASSDNLLKTMLYDLHVCSQRTIKDPSAARAPK